MYRWYCIPEETHTGRQVRACGCSSCPACEPPTVRSTYCSTPMRAPTPLTQHAPAPHEPSCPSPCLPILPHSPLRSATTWLASCSSRSSGTATAWTPFCAGRTCWACASLGQAPPARRWGRMCLCASISTIRPGRCGEAGGTTGKAAAPELHPPLRRTHWLPGSMAAPRRAGRWPSLPRPRRRLPPLPQRFRRRTEFDSDSEDEDGGEEWAPGAGGQASDSEDEEVWGPRLPGGLELC